MKALIVYQGKYGATKQYADWIADRLDLRPMPASAAMEPDLKHCDFLVLGCSVYVGKLLLTRWLRENIQCISGKKIFFFLVCGTPPDRKQKLQAYIRAGIPSSLREKMNVYFLPGKMKFNDLSWKDRGIVRIGALLSAKKKLLLEYNNVKEANLTPLLKDIQSYLSSDPTDFEEGMTILSEYF